MNPYEYLRGEKEDIPSWLNDFNEQSPFPREEFFKSRIVYYPGSGFDGHPVKLFGVSHSAHCFVYVDRLDWNLEPQNKLEQYLADPKRGFRGYNTLARLQLSERDLVTARFNPHTRVRGMPRHATTAVPPFMFLEILERDAKLDDDHGARRLAILFLGADGIASYETLFCQEHSGPPPFAVLLQEHGGKKQFGRDSKLYKVASRCNVFPKFLVVGEENTKPWEGYSKIKDIKPDIGGMSGHKRYLYKKV